MDGTVVFFKAIDNSHLMSHSVKTAIFTGIDFFSSTHTYALCVHIGLKLESKFQECEEFFVG